MSRERDALDAIEAIIEAIDAALAFVSGLELEQFRQDRKTHFAVVRALEIVRWRSWVRLLGTCLRPCANAIRRFRGGKWSVCATGLSMGMIR